jgi:sulfate adenylyltransferase subunit 1
VIVKTGDAAPVTAELDVLLCWLDEKPLQAGNKYLLHHNNKLVKTVVREVAYKIDVNTLEQVSGAGPIKLNEVVKASLKTAVPVAADAYAHLSAGGSAILVDETSNNTVAAVLLQ